MRWRPADAVGSHRGARGDRPNGTCLTADSPKSLRSEVCVGRTTGCARAARAVEAERGSPACRSMRSAPRARPGTLRAGDERTRAGAMRQWPGNHEPAVAVDLMTHDSHPALRAPQNLRHSGAMAGFIGHGTRNPALSVQRMQNWIPGSARKHAGGPGMTVRARWNPAWGSKPDAGCGQSGRSTWKWNERAHRTRTLAGHGWPARDRARKRRRSVACCGGPGAGGQS